METTNGKSARIRLAAKGVLAAAIAFGAVASGVTQRGGGTSSGQIPSQRPGTPQLGTIPQQGNPSLPTGVPPIDGGIDSNPLGRRGEDQQAKSRNNDRQRRLVADTEALLRLATELKTDVDKTNKDVLSIDVIKKAEEIEKLAHGVKERMKG